MLGDKVAGDRERLIGSLTAMRDDPGLLAGRAQAGLADHVGAPITRSGPAMATKMAARIGEDGRLRDLISMARREAKPPAGSPLRAVVEYPQVDARGDRCVRKAQDAHCRLAEP